MKFKNIAVPLFLVLTLSSSFASIDGTYSSNHKDMKCTGSWSHPFIPLDGKLDFGTPSDALLNGISSTVSISTENDGIEISLAEIKGKLKKVKLKEGKNKNIHLKSENDVIEITQKRLAQHNWDYGMYLGSVFNQRFKAVLKLDHDDNLILENYDASGFQRLKLQKTCILPRVN